MRGWPARGLTEPAVKALTELPWSEFPEGFRRDVDQYLRGLTQVRKGRTGRRIRPLKASTIRTRRVELAAAARMAVKTGVAIGDLSSFAAPVSPEVVGQNFNAHFANN